MFERGNGMTKRNDLFNVAPTPTWAYDIRSTDGDKHPERIDAIMAAVNAAQREGLGSWVPDLDTFLGAASPWVEPDILRAHMLAGGPLAPGTRLGFAFAPARDEVEARWYRVPVKVGGRPGVILLVGLDAEDYATL